MKLIRISLAGLSVAVAFAVLCCSAAPSDEAIALVKGGLQIIKSDGKDKAFVTFSDPKGNFVHGDLYLFVVDYTGLVLAHGGNPKLVGKNMNELKDANGNLFIKSMIEKAKVGGGWVDYKWTNPVTHKVQNKTTYVKEIEGANAFVGCGIYKGAQ